MKFINDFNNFILNESEKVFTRKDDPYVYKSDGTDWFSKKKDGDTWYNITGDDFKSGYEKSIELLDKEFPNARKKDAPMRDGLVVPNKSKNTKLENPLKGTIPGMDVK